MASFSRPEAAVYVREDLVAFLARLRAYASSAQTLNWIQELPATAHAVWVHRRAVGVVAITALAIRVLAPLVALSLPLRLAVRISLERELRRYGIRSLLPRACIAEIAYAASKSHANLAETKNWSLLLVKDCISTEIECDARAIRDWLYGASAAAGLPEYLAAVLRKHGVPFGLAVRQTDSSARW